jgi:hypothetical protein
MHKIMNQQEFTTWLLAARTPSIQYRTLVDLLHYPVEEARVVQARQAIMRSGPVPAILSHQTKIGNWDGERSYYTPKYTSTHWSLMLLTELNVEGSDPRFRQGVEYMLDTTAEKLGAQFEHNTFGIACFWGNLLRYALHAGLSEDARVEKIIHFTALGLQESLCGCEHNGGYQCAWGFVRALWGLAAIPEAHRTNETNEAITQGVKFLLNSFHLIEADYPTKENGSINSLWFKLNFPLFYQVDILFTLRVLDELNLLDHPGAKAALDWLEQCRGRHCYWPGASPFRQRTWLELGNREDTDRWVSIQASLILQHARRMPAFDKLPLNPTYAESDKFFIWRDNP